MNRLRETARPSPKTPRLRGVANTGYRKGEETRQRILDIALHAFGEDSFKTVTTRRIAEAAGVSLPTLQYYFGNKEGLYRACAEAIVERYRRHTSAAGAQAAQILKEDCTAEIARVRLKALIAALAGFLVGSEEAQRWGQFVSRELRDPGPAFETLYERLWRPGVEVTARLIARIRGSSESDPAARIEALLLISSVVAFQSGRTISLRSMGWSTVGPEQLTMVLSSLDTQIDAVGRQPS